MRYKRIYCLLFVLFSHQAYCQIDSILSLPGDDLQVKGFFDWAISNIFWDGEIDRERKLPLLKEATEKFNKTNNHRLIQECWFFTQLFKSRGEIGEPADVDQSVKIMLEAAKKANQKDWFFTEAQCRMAAAAIYFNKKRYRECFEQAHRAYDIFKKEGLDKYPEAGWYIALIADRYHFFGDYDAAIRYIKESLSVREPWNHFPQVYTALNTLAMCYIEREKYDSTVYYYQKAYDEAVKAGNKFWQGLIEGNMAQIYILMGEVDKALPLSLNDFSNSKANNQLGSAANAANDLAAIYMKKGNIATAENYLNYALQNYDTTYPKSKIRIYEKLSQLNALKNNYRQGYLFLDSFVHLNERFAKQRDAKVIDRTKLMVELEKYSSELKLMESEQKLQRLIRNGMAGGIILACIIAVLVVGRIRTKKNIAIKTATLEKRIVTEELARSKEDLKAFTNLLKEKNELIETFRSGIDKIKSDQGATDRIEVLSQLTKAIILTEDDWKQFRILFDKAYPGFFIRLKNKIPDLSAADTRMMALAKLQLSQKEMAAMLGVGYDAIRKARQRLRDKINLEKDDSIEELVNII